MNYSLNHEGDRGREGDGGGGGDGERETERDCQAVCPWFLSTTDKETLRQPPPKQNPGRRSGNNIGKTFVVPLIISDLYIIILMALMDLLFTNKTRNHRLNTREHSVGSTELFITIMLH